MPLYGYLKRTGDSVCIVCQKNFPKLKLAAHLQAEHELNLVSTCSQCYYNPESGDANDGDAIVKVDIRSNDTMKHAQTAHGSSVSSKYFSHYLCILCMFVSFLCNSSNICSLSAIFHARCVMSRHVRCKILR